MGQMPWALSYNCTKLFKKGMSVHLKFFQIIWVNQGDIFCNCSLHVIKCFLMYLVQVPSSFLGYLGFGDFGMVAPTYERDRGNWGKYFIISCPAISIVLGHAKEHMEVFDLFWQCDCKLSIVFQCLVTVQKVNNQNMLVVTDQNSGTSNQMHKNSLIYVQSRWCQITVTLTTWQGRQYYCFCGSYHNSDSNLQVI